MLLLVCPALVAGCRGDVPVERRAVTPPTVPTLPGGVFLQLYLPETGERYRVADDGRFLVAAGGDDERQQPPMSKVEPGLPSISERGLNRLRAAVEEAGFHSLPATVATNSSEDCAGPDAVLPGSGRPVTRQPVIFSVRDGETVKTVEGAGDLAVPCTLGPLEPIYRALDAEALGDWMNE